MKVEVEALKNGRVNVHITGMTQKQADALVDVGEVSLAIGKYVQGAVPEASRGKVTSVLRDVGRAVGDALDLTRFPGQQ